MTAHAARVVRLFNTYGHRITHDPADESWTFTIGEWTGPTCRDLDELETALHAARLGANAYVIGQRDRDWVAEVDRLRAIATANAAEAHEAHGELADVLRELARARSQVMQLEQELRLIQARGVDRA